MRIESADGIPHKPRAMEFIEGWGCSFTPYALSLLGDIRMTGRKRRTALLTLLIVFGVALAGCTESDQTDDSLEDPTADDGEDLPEEDGGEPSGEEKQDEVESPHASFTFDCEDLTCTFDASGTEPGDAGISGYEWAFGDGSFATGEAPEHSYADGGTYTVELTVTDENDETDSATQEVDITAPAGPTASLSVTCSDLTCTFDGTSSQAGDAQVIGYEWELGDGATATGETTEHTYDAGGPYTVSLTVTDANDQQDTATQNIQVTAPPPDPIAFSGTGDDVTDSFTTQQRLLKFELSHDGSSNFIVDLLTSDGEKEELLANEIGGYHASRYFNPPADDYLLDIDADGNWEITIHQPRPDTGEQAPLAFSGQGNTASDVMALEEGLHTFEMTHNGDSNFIVHLYDDEGDRIALVVNEIGEYDGSTAERIPSDGLYVLDIVADGDWTIDVTS